MSEIKSPKAKKHIREFILDKKFNDGKEHLCVRAETAVLAVHYAEAEAEERHANELQAVKDKAIEAYISTCIKNENGVCCIDDGECPVNCHRVELFTQKLNEQ